VPQLPPPPPMHMQPSSVFVPLWPNPSTHHQMPYNQSPHQTPPQQKQEGPDSSSLGMMGMVNIINAISGAPMSRYTRRSVRGRSITEAYRTSARESIFTCPGLTFQ
jgi:hypothetical protein